MNKKTEQAVRLLKAGEFDRALKQLNAIISSGTSDPDVFSYRGVVLLNLNRHQEAIGDFDRAVLLQPDYSYRYASRAFARDAVGDLEGAISDYEKAIALDPDDAIAHNNLGLLVEKAGNKSAAKKHFESADKMAEAFFDKNGSSSPSTPEPNDAISIQPQKLKPDVQKVNGKMFWTQLSSILSSGTELKKFARFVLNGFKTKA